MVNAIEKAQRGAKKAIESTYDGKCTIYERHPVWDENTDITGNTEVMVLDEQPCRISYKTISANSETGSADTVKQLITLFIAPEIEVKPGSKLVVTQSGITQTYSRSGVSAVYPSHKEISLELFARWA